MFVRIEQIYVYVNYKLRNITFIDVHDGLTLCVVCPSN